jgi:serine/threonine protein phosphatase PrpC
MNDRFDVPHNDFAYAADQRAASRGEDRVGVFDNGSTCTIVVADGAGGISGGGAAASEAILAAAAFAANTSRAADQWCHFIFELDRRMAAQAHFGETTLVVVQVTESQLHGASVGDSGAWLISSAQTVDLTEHQHRKPLVGSGSALPSRIVTRPLVGRLLVATDGLFKYVDHQRIIHSAIGQSLASSTQALIDSARLSNGEFPDDISLVLGERAG